MHGTLIVHCQGTKSLIVTSTLDYIPTCICCLLKCSLVRAQSGCRCACATNLHMLLETAFFVEGTSPSADQAQGSSVATLVNPSPTDPLPPTTVVPMGQQTLSVIKPEYYRYLPGPYAAMFSCNPSSNADQSGSQVRMQLLSCSLQHILTWCAYAACNVVGSSHLASSTSCLLIHLPSGPVSCCGVCLYVQWAT